MAEIFKDGFDHYGYVIGSNPSAASEGRLRMLDGPWAEVTGTSGDYACPAQPSFGARTGEACLVVEVAPQLNVFARRVLPGGARNTLILSFGLYLPFIPSNTAGVLIVNLRSVDNQSLTGLVVMADGGLSVSQGGRAGAKLTRTAGPVLSAGTWHHVEVLFTRDAAAGIAQIRVDEVEVLNATNLALGALDYGQIVLCNAIANGSLSDSNNTPIYFDDLIVRDTTGTDNNTFMGDLRISTLYPTADRAGSGWTPRSRQHIGAGILDVRPVGSALSTPADALHIEASDYTAELSVRFSAIPAAGTAATLLSHSFATSAVSWRLCYGGPGHPQAGKLFLVTSPDGTVDNETVLFAWTWTPQLNVWYALAVCRSGGTGRFFIDGKEQGLGYADAGTYFTSTAPFAIGATMSTPTAVAANTDFNGFVDEVRFTIGTGRYTANYVPRTTPFPRNSTDDPHWNNVLLLLSFDVSLVNESQYPRTMTARNGAARLQPGDGGAAYRVINEVTPIDDNFIEAALVPATGILTLPDLPLDTQTVTIGSKTYTFKTTLAGADDVLIGATPFDCLNNLAAAVIGGAGEGTVYGAGTTASTQARAERLDGADQLLATALTAGATGNSISTTTTVTGASWATATLTGGADIPAASEFLFGTLPPEVTGIRSMTIVNRAFKSDSGSSEVQVSFVGKADGVLAGAARPLATDPTYYEDTFTVDPDTGNPLTPSSFAGARLKINRTL